MYSLDHKLYCQCTEKGNLWASPSDAEENIPLKDWQYYKYDNGNLIFSKFEEAPEKEIIEADWDKPANKVTICNVCHDNNSLNYLPTRHGWVTIKKNTQNGKMFCMCETCGSVWEDIKDALNPPTFKDRGI